MGIGRYRFTRDGRNVTGLMSPNYPSTDALGALNEWSGTQKGRRQVVVIDQDEQLVADLSWSDADSSAGPDLDSACLKFGVNRSYVGT
jgi:hypothetical protein